MKFNRRGFFGLLAAAPIALPALAETVECAPTPTMRHGYQSWDEIVQTFLRNHPQEILDDLHQNNALMRHLLKNNQNAERREA